MEYTIGTKMLMVKGTGYDDYSTGVLNFRRLREDAIVTVDSEPVRSQIRVMFPDGKKGVAAIHTLKAANRD